VIKFNFTKNVKKMTIYNVYDEIAEFIAELNPTKVKQIKASKEVQNRFDFLVEKSKNELLLLKEQDELNHYIVLERLIRLAKIRASKLATQ
jgi:hypothetical protein